MTTENNDNQIDVASESIEPPSWIPGLVAFSHAVLDHLDLSGWELSVLLTDDDRIRALNRDYRGRDEVTDVLSFSALDDDTSPIVGGRTVAGDIVLDVAQVYRQAEELGITGEEELRRTVVHGILHLAGHDHDGTDFATDPMLRLQETILTTVKERVF